MNLWKQDETQQQRQEREQRWALEIHAWRVLNMPQADAQAYLSQWEQKNTPELRTTVRRLYRERQQRIDSAGSRR